MSLRAGDIPASLANADLVDQADHLRKRLDVLREELNRATDASSRAWYGEEIACLEEATREILDRAKQLQG